MERAVQSMALAQRQERRRWHPPVRLSGYVNETRAHLHVHTTMQRRGSRGKNEMEQARLAAFRDVKGDPLSQFWHGVSLIPDRRPIKKTVRKPL